MLYKYEMLRDSYLGVTRRNYYNIERLVTKLKFVKFDTNQIEKIVDSHLSISKIAYVGDGFMSKVNSRCNSDLLDFYDHEKYF